MKVIVMAKEKDLQILKNITILYVEDEDTIREHLSEFLRNRVGILYTAKNGQEGLDLFEKHKPDIVVTDIKMPIIDGVKMAETIKEKDHTVPIIVITAYADKDLVIKSINTGIDKYVLKPVKQNVLIDAVYKSAVVLLSYKDLRHQAVTDSLTGLYNRAKFNELLLKEIQRSKRYKTPISLILFDVDHFKSINDSCGHQVGDGVLQDLSGLVSGNIRDQDIIARWGGEEFVILTPENAVESAKELADKLRLIIEEYNFDDVDVVTCSFGVAQFTDNDTVESFVKRADDALYKAKEKGRNLVIVE